MSEFSKAAAAAIEKYRMCNKGERLLVCLSGGADSVALLLCLLELGYKVSACHVNHCLRGEESERDEEFCRRLCERLGVPFDSTRIDVTAYCEEQGVSTELGARELRYRYFESFDCDRICTAHTLSDRLETAVFNLARGSGLKGISSIPPVRGRFIRPLCELTREEVEAYLESRGQDYVTDSTNLEDLYSRNKIRHRIIPVMRELNSGLFTSYLSTSRALLSDSDLLEGMADELFEKCRLEKGWDCEALKGAHESILRRVIIRIMAAEGLEARTAQIERLDEIIRHGGRQNVCEGVFANVSKGILTFDGAYDPDDRAEEIKVPENGGIAFMGRRIDFEVIAAPDEIANIHKKFTNCCLDYDKIYGELVVRGRKSGDKIKLCSRDFTSDVRKLINSRFRTDERNGAVILADGEGVVFVESFGAAERVKLDNSTKRILVFRIS
ncbi:MAG: tRNA lysidine(34) synthetase TilS [Ruminococcus sp.]|nr:tRNA lysidine(34) synthetase TilS [Ruminococcus sp.]